MRRIPFWDRVDKSGDCWEWTGIRNRGGYGLYVLSGPTRPRKARMAHRVAYEALVGPIPEGLDLDHLCRNRGCVRPDHVEPVSHRVNTLRGNTLTAINAAKTHCKRDHEFTPENTYRHKDGRRECWTCKRENRRRAA